ncbi:MAG: lipid-A-disaccharide synthase N-terminal domain-containing protein [Neomegalonema sp.]|nr:lipid-A-disaccharide synthase N-terminal domain-containing protein [Neomegalonema sp.]
MSEWIFWALGVDSMAKAAWVGFGLLGQMLFMGRFLVQWIASERAGRVVIPVAFWWFSIGGALILLSYAIYTGDRVFIIGQSTGMIIYIRNLMLHQREKRALAQPAEVDG